MIYAAVLSSEKLEKKDFERVMAHNETFKGEKFKGNLDLAEVKNKDGGMNQYVFRLKDENINSDELTFLVMFNNSTEEKSLEEYQFMLNRHFEQIDNFLNEICDLIEVEEVEQDILINGNIIYRAKESNFQELEKLFTKSLRNKMKAI